MDKLWGVWQLDDLIGEGSYGKVYKAIREEFGTQYHSAVKHIELPQNRSHIRSLYSEGLISDEASARNYYKQITEDLLTEIELMYHLRGNTNIVSYEDHMIVEKTDMPGYDIYIRMELLKSLETIMSERVITESDVVKMGIDICSGLMLLWQNRLIHRDIKPANIFINNNGSYKLGDFGVARQIEKTSTIMSKKGTYTYMAPELYKGETAGITVDTYSLGLVMYRLLNGNRAPFLPVSAEHITYTDNESALNRRMSGEMLPKPAFADDKLTEIILKASSHNPRDRYQSPEEMRTALQRYANIEVSKAVPIIAAVNEKTPVRPVINIDEKTQGIFGQTLAEDLPKEPSIKPEPIIEPTLAPKKKSNWWIALIVLALIAIPIIATLVNKEDEPVVIYEPETEITTTTAALVTETEPPETTTAAPETEPETTRQQYPDAITLDKTSLELIAGNSSTLYTTISPKDVENGEITWTSSNANIATVSNGKVTAKSAGTVTITAKTANNKTAICNVTVKKLEVTEVMIDTANISINVGGSHAFTVKITPGGVAESDKKITATSSNANIASVSGFTVTGKSAGTATVTFKAPNGVSTSCKVTVNEVMATGVTVTPTSLEMTAGESYTLSASIMPGNVTNKTVDVTSSNTNVVIINGLTVRAVGAGTATVTVTTSNGKTASCVIVVKAAPVVVNNTPPQNTQQTQNTTPKPQQNQNTTPQVVQQPVVVEKPKTEAKKEILPTGVSVNPSSLTLEYGQTYTLAVTITPSDATDKTFKVVSANTDIITTSNSNITAVGTGSTTITITTNNGKTTKCSVNIVGGKYTWTNGDIYEGEWVNNKRTGKGKYTWVSGDVYEGDFVDGKRTGYGKCTWLNGNGFKFYEGEWLNGDMHGTGTMTFYGGDIYEGGWRNGVKHGYGKYTWYIGTSYKMYEGDFVDDAMSGKGKVLCLNGDVYEGEWRNYQKHGKGTYIYANGTIEDGYWNNDIYVGQTP